MGNDKTIKRTAIARANIMLSLAEECSIKEREQYEALVEAAIIFARAGLHRWKKDASYSCEKWRNIENNNSVKFLKNYRDMVLKESEVPFTQIIDFSQNNAPRKSDSLYCFEVGISACQTVREHLKFVESLYCQKN